MVQARTPAEIVALARESHARGDDRRTILRTAYGVPFPEEVFVILDRDWDYQQSNVLPWTLAADEQTPDELWLAKWQEVYDVDPMLVPLDQDSEHVVAYRLDELAAGRATIFTLQDRSYVRLGDVGFDEPTRAEDSYLAYRHARATDQLRRDEAELAGPYQGGEGSISSSDVVFQRGVVTEIEDLQRELAFRLEATRTV